MFCILAHKVFNWWLHKQNLLGEWRMAVVIVFVWQSFYVPGLVFFLFFGENGKKTWEIRMVESRCVSWLRVELCMSGMSVWKRFCVISRLSIIPPPPKTSLIAENCGGWIVKRVEHKTKSHHLHTFVRHFVLPFLFSLLFCSEWVLFVCFICVRSKYRMRERANRARASEQE